MFILVSLQQICQTTAKPIETSSFYSNFESSPSPTSEAEQRLEIKSEISETVSKILRLMHSLSNKSVLVAPSSPGNLASQANFNLNELKRDHKPLAETKTDQVLLNNRELNERLNSKLNLKKLTNRLIGNLNKERSNERTFNERSTNNERFNDNFNDENVSPDSGESDENNLFERLRERSNASPFAKQLKNELTKEFSLAAKYPTTTTVEEQKTTAATTSTNYFRTNPIVNEMIRGGEDGDDESRAFLINLPAYLKQFSRLNHQTDESRGSSKDELQSTKDHKKNLYDMVENEEEDLGEEEHNMHNYNISQLSDRDLNRTLIDIQWLLDQNLSKQEMESKFSSKGRNNRNKIAQRIEYFDKLYRNIHQLTNNAPTNVKRGESPHLSVVSPLDILRDKLILEIARRKIEQSKSQMKENEDYLKKMG